MKALSFLDWFSEVKLTNIDITGQDRKVLDKVKVTSNFYSQEFKPEMIVEYFEGWENESDISYYCSSIDKRISFVNTSYNIFTKRPRTLDQFISDCSRAKIELTWKEEIVNKYFNK